MLVVFPEALEKDWFGFLQRSLQGPQPKSDVEVFEARVGELVRETMGGELVRFASHRHVRSDDRCLSPEDAPEQVLMTTPKKKRRKPKKDLKATTTTSASAAPTIDDR
jgi:hypothetical protein